ncbi:MAG: hypothetical protein N2747_10540, partial [Chitinophagaceae bacterium]|nr:hypothetical protein [Chitinophagaceae bacterium]
MLPEFSQSQSCFQTGFQGSIKQYVCPQACSDISFRIPHIRSIDHYTVISLPYQPYPWTNPTGTELTEIYSDDRYSSAIPLPFPFCFCASVYHSVVVGSNGVITFDVSQAN